MGLLSRHESDPITDTIQSLGFRVGAGAGVGWQLKRGASTHFYGPGQMRW